MINILHIPVHLYLVMDIQSSTRNKVASKIRPTLLKQLQRDKTQEYWVHEERETTIPLKR